VIRDLGLTSQQVWGLTKTDQEWSAELEAALTAARRDDLEHGTNAAYVNGCVCAQIAGSASKGNGQETGGDNCTPPDCEALERWTGIRYERGMRFAQRRTIRRLLHR
jgi:hypothetical protein